MANDIITTQQAECVDCYRCLRNCPVKSISFVTKQAKIDEDRCILCGRCVVECPQNAKVYLNNSENVIKMLQGDDPVILSIAPSYLGSFEQAPQQLYQDVINAGFANLEETAIGATLTTREYRRLLNEPQWQDKTGLSTCCPVIVNLVEKYFPNLQKNLLPALSPMVAHSRLIKAQHGQHCKVVFAGPCIAKLDEARRFGVDSALTFGQLKVILLEQKNRNIKFHNKKAHPDFAYQEQWMPTRSFPIHNGVLFSVKGAWGSDQDYWSIEGMDQCLEVLRALDNGDISPKFIEMMACQGGCVGGPAIDSKYNLYKRKQIIQDVIKNSSQYVIAEIPEATFSMSKSFQNKAFDNCPFSEEQIQEVLHKMGKHSKKDERNCEGCGYISCREKAIGVLNGLATIDMCIPAMRSKAESLSHTVMENTPNAILVMDKDMTLKEFNPAAISLFNQVTLEVGMDLKEFIDISDFRKAYYSRSNVYDQRVEYIQWQLITRQTMVPILAEHLLMVIIEDISKTEMEKQKLEKMKKDVMDKAKKVINQQMTVAQTIASLLGETTAETKASLYELLKHLEGKEHDDIL